MNAKQSFHSLATQSAQDIPQPKRHMVLRFGLPIGIVAFSLALLIATAWSALVPARSVQAITVAIRPVESTITARQSTPGSLIQAPGWVEPDPFAIFVPALTEGVVQDILVLEGEKIEVGQVVAKLVDDDARIRVSKAEANLAIAQAKDMEAIANLQAASTEKATLIEPKRRLAIAKATTEQLEAVWAKLGADIVAEEAARAELLDELTRKKDLVDDGVVAEAYIVRLQKRIDVSEAKIVGLQKEQNATRSRIDASREESIAAEQDLELQIEETLNVAIAQAHLVDTKAAITLAKTQLAEAQLELDRCQVRTPVSGIVIERLTSPGSTINFGNGMHGAHILHVYDPEKLQVRSDIPLADASRVGAGQRAEIIVDLLPDTVFQGVVTRFLHKADIQKNTVEAKVKIIDPSPLLKPEMLARVRILPASASDSEGGKSTVQRVFIPSNTISTQNETPTVWVIDELNRGKGRAQQRSILLGESVQNGWVEVVEGLNPGDKIILDGTGLDPGDHVVLTEGEA